MYLKSILEGSVKSLQLAGVPKHLKNEQDEFVWPCMCILVNLPPGLIDGAELKEQLSPFRPLEVAIIRNLKDQILCAIIKFAEDWSGFDDALAFETHFIQNKYGKADWNQGNYRRRYPYGWLARFDDYHSPEPFGGI
jgi:hypothetical protein